MRHQETPTTCRHKHLLMKRVVVSDDPDGCWGWIACTKETGYGRIRIDRVEYIASRLAYAVHSGRDPGPMDVCHSCDNPVCTNPRHLFLSDHTGNMRDAVLKGRWEHKGRGASRNRGLSNPSARITDDQIASIRDLYRTGGLRQRDIAARFGVSQSYVSMVVSGALRADQSAGE